MTLKYFINFFYYKLSTLHSSGWLGLVDGPNEQRGRTEAYLLGRWGTICDKSFNKNGWPRTFCGDMGYGKCSTAIFAKNMKEGKGIGNIAWKGPNCSRPSNLKQCLKSRHKCDHDTDVVIKCLNGL